MVWLKQNMYFQDLVRIINKQEVKQSTIYLRLIKLNDHLEIYIDVSNGRGKIIKPNKEKIQLEQAKDSLSKSKNH